MGGGSLSWWYVQQHALLLLRVQDAADCLRKGTADTCCSCVGGGPLSHRNYQGPMHHRKWRGLAVMITLQSTERCRTERLAAGAEHRSRQADGFCGMVASEQGLQIALSECFREAAGGSGLGCAFVWEETNERRRSESVMVRIRVHEAARSRDE